MAQLREGIGVEGDSGFIRRAKRVGEEKRTQTTRNIEIRYISEKRGYRNDRERLRAWRIQKGRDVLNVGMTAWNKTK
jgi:hypothetical protein